MKIKFLITKDENRYIVNMYDVTDGCMPLGGAMFQSNKELEPRNIAKNTYGILLAIGVENFLKLDINDIAVRIKNCAEMDTDNSSVKIDLSRSFSEFECEEE